MGKNEIRTGRVSNINYASGMVEVTYFDRGESVTHWVSMLSNGEYRMPRVGELVQVAHNSNGAAFAAVIGTMWNEANRPAEGFEGLYRKEYGSGATGKAYERYDEKTGAYTKHVDGSMTLDIEGPLEITVGGTSVVISGEGIEIFAPKAEIHAAGGDVAVGGTSLNRHTHRESDGGQTGNPQ